MEGKDIRTGIGTMESGVLSDLVAEGKTIFSIKDLVEKTGSPTKARKMASALVKKNWLVRLKKGTYLALELAAGSKPVWSEDSFYIASYLCEPYYVGFYSMLNFYGWTEQIPVTVSIVTTKTPKPKVILGVKYEFATFPPEKFFGFTKMHIRGHWVTVSDKEKTLIDSISHPEYAGGIEEVAKALFNAKNEINWNTLLNYAIKMKNGAIIKRLGFLIDLMEIPVATEIRDTLKNQLSTGFARLTPGIKKAVHYDTKWKIMVNTDISKNKVLA